MKANTPKNYESQEKIIDLDDIYVEELEEDDEIIELTEVYYGDEEKVVQDFVTPEPIIIKLEGKDIGIDEKKIEGILCGIIKQQFYKRISDNMDSIIERILIDEIDEMQNILVEISE